MGRKEEFQAQVLYHGTAYPFKVGDIIVPRSKWGAFATYDPRAAASYSYTNAIAAREAFEDAGDEKSARNVRARVYTVEPLEDDDTYMESHGLGGKDSDPITEVISQKGFRVTGERNGA